MPLSKLRMASKNRLYGSIEWLRWVYRMARMALMALMASMGALRASMGVQNGFGNGVDGCIEWLLEWLRWVYRMALRL